MLRNPLKRPDVLGKTHVVHPDDSPRIEVVLNVGRLDRIEANDGDAVRSIWMVNFPTLDQEAPSREPLEDGERIWSFTGVQGETRGHAPPPDQWFQNAQFFLHRFLSRPGAVFRPTSARATSSTAAGRSPAAPPPSPPRSRGGGRRARCAPSTTRGRRVFP